MDFPPNPDLDRLRELLDKKEEGNLSPLATLSSEAVRRFPDERGGHRQAFSLDSDRILHSRAYTRYIDKTQVFYMVTNDHITHRVLHVQLVAKIARSVGRFLGLNEDLIEAIALGHDIGHPPFGHDGERFLADLCEEYGLPSFHHNIQSVIFLDRIERGGEGWNLTLQTMDGILFHDGEAHNDELRPCRSRHFTTLDRVVDQTADDLPADQELPMTLEGCVVRLCDTIGYIGRDIEDAIELQLIRREDIPRECSDVLGNTNGAIVYRLVTDLITNGCADDRIFFNPETAAALEKLKEFNYERIYRNPVIKNGFEDIRNCYRSLFEAYMADISNRRSSSEIFGEFLDRISDGYLEKTMPAAMVRDFIAGMTDEYFLARAAALGCRVPIKTNGRLNHQDL